LDFLQLKMKRNTRADITDLNINLMNVGAFPDITYGIPHRMEILRGAKSAHFEMVLHDVTSSPA
jgi:hypothetical protein